MNIIGMKPGHDGSIAWIRDSKLCCNYQAEIGSYTRYADLTVDCIVTAAKTP